MKGKIPNTAEMLLESTEGQWRLLSRGLINQLNTSAIIELPNKKIKIQLIIHTIIPPENSSTSITYQIESNANETMNTGLARIASFLAQKLENRKWIFVGEIIGDNKIPIVIIHYALLQKTIYSIKTHNEKTLNFLPNFLNN